MLAFGDEGTGPAIVFVHGLGSDRTRWDPILERLVTRFRCVAVDLPGHGRSSDEGCDGLGAATAIHDVVTGLGLESPVLVGHSLGATVSLLYGALFGPRSVVAVDPVHLYLPHLSERLAPYRDRLAGDDFAAAFEEWETTLAGAERADALRSGLLPRRGVRQDVVLSYWKATLDRDAAVSLQPRFEEALATITVPVLVWLADTPTAEDEGALARMPTTTVEVSPGAGHFFHLADPDGFVDRLEAWVDSLAS